MLSHSPHTKSPRQQAVLIFGGAYLALYLIAGFFFDQLSVHRLIFWIYDGVGLTLFPLVAYFVLLRRADLTARDFGWLPLRSEFYGVKFCIVDSIWLLLIWAFFMFFFSKMLWNFLWPIEEVWATVSTTMRPSSGIGWIVVGLWWSIQPAFIEECFFRGLFKTFFSFFKFEKAQKAVYVLASGMLFGLGHIPQGVIAVLSTTLVGVFFAYQHLKIKHILPFVIAHCIGNLISLFFF